MPVASRLNKLALAGIGRLPPNARRLINVARGIDTPALLDRPPGTHVLVLAPHPDDEILGCGGTIAKHVAAGDHVTIALLTSGERSAGLVGQSGHARRDEREEEARRAMKRLGVADGAVDFLRLPDGAVPEAGDALDDLLHRTRPDLVYAPVPIDAHRDHRATAKLLDAAVEGAPSIEHVAFYEVWTALYPNVIVDISETIDTKLAALAHYESALRAVDYVNTARGLAAYRSAQGLRGRGYAEAFLLVDRSSLHDLMTDLG